MAETSKYNGDAAWLLDDVHAFLRRFVAYPSEHCSVAHTLWVAHTHFIDVWESTPRLAFLSPEPASGKTRALEITELLVPRPVEAINVTPAYLFRKVGDPAGTPTILFDEIDTVFGPKAKDNEEIRGLLNAGHRRGAVAGRCVARGRNIVTEEIPAFCAVALAGLGSLPDTILSRSVIIRMRRRTPDEKIEPYRRSAHAAEGHELRYWLTAWAASETMRAKGNIPDFPKGVEDRDADVWEALISLAELAGGEWPERARVSAVTLVSHPRDSATSLGVRLLSDLRDVFGDRAAMFTADILKALIAMDEAPWGELKGKPLDPRGLARFLRPYGVTRKQVRVELETKKGYDRADLEDPWRRYLRPDYPNPIDPNSTNNLQPYSTVSPSTSIYLSRKGNMGNIGNGASEKTAEICHFIKDGETPLESETNSQEMGNKGNGAYVCAICGAPGAFLGFADEPARRYCEACVPQHRADRTGAC